MLPTYREVFNTLEGHFSLKILSRASNPFETDKKKVRYDPVYEEVVEKPHIYKE